jgi:hypothetical protein
MVLYASWGRDARCFSFPLPFCVRKIYIPLSVLLRARKCS